MDNIFSEYFVAPMISNDIIDLGKYNKEYLFTFFPKLAAPIGELVTK